jgi:hypothetical protein
VISRGRILFETPKDQLMSQIKMDDLGWRLNLTGDRLDRFYEEVSREK